MLLELRDRGSAHFVGSHEIGFEDGRDLLQAVPGDRGDLWNRALCFRQPNDRRSP